jgi:hypothetical protein
MKSENTNEGEALTKMIVLTSNYYQLSDCNYFATNIKVNMKDENVKDVINIGADITGGLGGALIGLLVAGPLGGVIGAGGAPVITTLIKRLAAEIKERLLGPREQVRIGAVYSFAIDKILKNKETGKELRQDSFFDTNQNERSAAEEIFEGVILKAQREYEETKLCYYGNLLGNIVFDGTVDKVLSNQLLRLAEELSYNQLCMIKIFHPDNNFKWGGLRTKNYRKGQIQRELITILYDLIDLENKQLFVNPINHVFGITDIVPSEFQTQGNANLLYSLMQLNDIPDEHCKTALKLLSI